MNLSPGMIPAVVSSLASFQPPGISTQTSCSAGNRRLGAELDKTSIALKGFLPHNRGNTLASQIPFFVLRPIKPNICIHVYIGDKDHFDKRFLPKLDGVGPVDNRPSTD